MNPIPYLSIPADAALPPVYDPSILLIALLALSASCAIAGVVAAIIIKIKMK